MNEHKHIAIFGDTHGHLRLMFQLARLWQLEHETHLDGVLLCGDIGFFPDVSRLDKATKRYADRDPEELGFANYFALPKPPRTDKLLQQILINDGRDLNAVRCPVVFCHGNHADFDALEKTTCGAALTPVDSFGRIEFLRSGEVLDVAGVSVGAIGGAPEEGGQDDAPVLGKFVSGRAAERLHHKKFDVLLSHGAPWGIGGESDRRGSQILRELVQRRRPVYHVYAHHSHRIPTAQIGPTTCKWLNDTNFQRTRHGNYNGPVEPGCMALLRWRDEDDHELREIEEPWFRRITGTNWRHF